MLKSIINQYSSKFKSKYAAKLLPSHFKTLNAISTCRTPEAGELYVHCPQCNHSEHKPLSCGNRNCPICQNYETSQWIDRQTNKLLPVLYYMVTFTLPFELRALTWHHQREIYSILFDCVASTLKDFGLNPEKLGAQIGMTMVLHTHNRRLDFHPHIHVVVPGGGIIIKRRQWKKKKGRYLFNQNALAKVFRARFLAALNKSKLSIPHNVPAKWVVDCSRVGQGITALKYLSRYLYRGVINEKNIISNKNGKVVFKYIESKTKKIKYRALAGEDFLYLIMQHVLPKGFRRARDYGFLHGNAKKLLFLIQLVLHVSIKSIKHRPRPVFKCPCCNFPMVILGFCLSSPAPG